MLGCMISFALERWIPHTSVAITRNNDVVCFMSWTQPSLNLLTIFYIMSPSLSKRFFHGGGWTWRLVAIFLFFHIGGGIIQCHKFTHINNPWFFRVIFINFIIIRFIVINVQIGKVHKHGGKTVMIRSIPYPTILNDIFFNEISTCKKNDNLMFAQVSTQHPFICVTNIFVERKWDLVCHIHMLALYHPCMAGIVRIIYLMGDIGVKDRCHLLNMCFHNVFHNLILTNSHFFILITCM